MPRNKKKPNYIPDVIMQDLIDSITESYENLNCNSENGTSSIRQLAADFSMSPLKMRKLLITAGLFHSEMCDQVNGLYKAGRTIPEIQSLLNLSRSSVHSYLPYSKIVYNATELSANADRIRIYRRRRDAVERLQSAISSMEISISELLDILWKTIASFEYYPFWMGNGRKFDYKIKENKILVSHKGEYIPREQVNIAFQEVLKMHGKISGQEDLAVSDYCIYLYTIFHRFGIVEHR